MDERLQELDILRDNGPMKSREWKQIDAYHIKSGEWTICKYGGIGYKYALWRGETLVKFSNDINELKGLADAD